MAGKLKRYAYINAKLRGRISKITPDEIFFRMAGAQSPAEALQVLSNTSFSEFEDVYAKTGDLKMVENHIQNQEINLYLDLERNTTGIIAEFIGALTVRFEIENLKNALRLWFNRVIRERDIDRSYLFRKRIQYSINFDSIIDAGSLEEIAVVLNNTPYGRIVSESINSIKGENRLFKLEMALDLFFYRQLFAVTERLPPADSVIARRILGAEVDIQNINWLFRFKDLKLPVSEVLGFIIPYGSNISCREIETAYSSAGENQLITDYLKKSYSGLQGILSNRKESGTSRLFLLERILDEIILYEIRRILAGPPFTIGIILSYFILKRNEFNKIMIILNAVAYGIDENRIKSEL